MKKIIVFAMIALSSITYAQTVAPDSTATSDESIKGTWDLNLDLAARYIWRGQSWGGNFPVAQLYGNYNITEKLSAGFWTTHNFRKEYYDINGTTKGYQELDIVLNYTLSDFLTVSLQDYYWPSTNHQEGVSNDFFNFGNNGSQSVDMMLMFDFSEYEFPLWFTSSTLVAGNDYRYRDDNDTKGKQNFTTYMEVGYSFEAPLGFGVAPVVGAVLNNKAQYYTYGDYDKPSFVNLGCKLTKEIKLTEHLTMPVWLNYTFNAARAKENLEPFGPHLLVAGATFTLTN